MIVSRFKRRLLAEIGEVNGEEKDDEEEAFLTIADDGIKSCSRPISHSLVSAKLIADGPMSPRLAEAEAVDAAAVEEVVLLLLEVVVVVVVVEVEFPSPPPPPPPEQEGVNGTSEGPLVYE